MQNQKHTSYKYSFGRVLRKRHEAMGRAPKYQQITEWIQNQIVSGELSNGDRLESEHELSARFQLSRQTVRHALSELEEAGIVSRVKGSGTYIRYGTGSTEPLSQTVTIISTYADSYIFPKLLQVMVRRLSKAGYSTKIMFTNNRVETEGRLLRQIMSEDSRDPLLVEPVMSGLPNPNLGYYRKLQAAGIPILFFHSFYPELSIPHVSMDDRAVGRAATEYLLSRGHTRIGGIFKSDDGQGRLRYAGFTDAMRASGVEIREERISWIDTQELRDQLSYSPYILRRLQTCSACICYNDEIAHLVTEQCLAAGIRIPEDLSLISVDNSELAKLNAVPLTSVIHPLEALGEKVAENLLQLIADKRYEATFEFAPEIEERMSAASI